MNNNEKLLISPPTVVIEELEFDSIKIPPTNNIANIPVTIFSNKLIIVNIGFDGNDQKTVTIDIQIRVALPDHSDSQKTEDEDSCDRLSH